jgi:membrane-associated phospholipid phosphatase
MSLTLLVILFAATAALLALERRRLPAALNLPLKGDIKRESWWIQQYGQVICTGVAAWLVWELDPAGDATRKAVTIVVTVAVTSLACGVLKRLFGRVRPGREPAGKFLGPSFRLHGVSHRHSFPSGHTAGAVALTGILAAYYPHAAGVFWFLAVACATMRYVLDAHWPSDITAGMAVGYLVAHAGMRIVPVVFDFVMRIAGPYLPTWLKSYL